MNTTTRYVILSIFILMKILSITIKKIENANTLNNPLHHRLIIIVMSSFTTPDRLGAGAGAGVGSECPPRPTKNSRAIRRLVMEQEQEQEQAPVLGENTVIPLANFDDDNKP